MAAVEANTGGRREAARPLRGRASATAWLLAGYLSALGLLVAVKAASDARGAADVLGYVLAYLAVGGVSGALGAAFLSEAKAARENEAAAATLERMGRALAGGRCGAWFHRSSDHSISLDAALGAALDLPAGTRIPTRVLLARAAPEAARAFAAFLSGEGPGEIDVRMRKADGREGETVRFRRNERGTDGLMSGAAFAVSADAADDREARALQALLDDCAEAAALWTADGDRLAANAAFEALMDGPFGADEAFERVIGPLPRGETARADTAAAGGRWYEIRRRRTSDGGAVATLADITETRRRDEKIERLAGELDRLSTSLSIAEERAELAGRTKRELLANVSHELRTPLNAVIGFSEMMRAEPFGALGDPRYKEYLDAIHASGRKLLRLVDDMLQMSDLESGGARTRPRQIDFAEIVRAETAAANEEPEAAEVAIDLSVKGRPRAYADPDATRHVVAHLLSNAVKYAGPGGRVTVAVLEEPGGAVVLVADDGAGIDKETLARLGSPFELAEDHLSKTAQGAGLGLALARSLTTMMNGVLAIASRPSAGTIAALSLPRGPDAPAAPARAMPRGARVLAAPRPAKSEAA